MADLSRHRWKVFAALSLALAGLSPDPASAIDVRTLSSLCGSKSFSCSAYIEGVVDALEYSAPSVFCLDHRFTLAQDPRPNDDSAALVMLINLFITESPSSDRQAPEFILEWLRDHYSCH